MKNNPTPQGLDSLRETLARNGLINLSDVEVQLFDQIIATHIDSERKETAKAYGGCTKCYGKGYATWRHGETYRGNTKNMRNEIKYCSCGRGEQLQEVVDSENTKARLDEAQSIYIDGFLKHNCGSHRIVFAVRLETGGVHIMSQEDRVAKLKATLEKGKE